MIDLNYEIKKGELSIYWSMIIIRGIAYKLQVNNILGLE